MVATGYLTGCGMAVAEILPLPHRRGCSCHTGKSPDPAFAGSGLVEPRFGLVAAGVRREALPVAQVVDVAEHRRSWRQVLRLGEQRVESVVSNWRRVRRIAAVSIDAGVIGRIVHADQRSLVVEGVAAPVFQQAQEVVQSAVGAEVAAGPAQSVNWEVDVLATGDGYPVVGGQGIASADVGRIRAGCSDRTSRWTAGSRLSAITAAAACAGSAAAGFPHVGSAALLL